MAVISGMVQTDHWIKTNITTILLNSRKSSTNVFSTAISEAMKNTDREMKVTTNISILLSKPRIKILDSIFIFHVI